MGSRWFPAPLVSAGVWLAALLSVAWGLVQDGFSPRDWITILVAAAVVVVGEVLEVDLRGGRSTPVSSGIVFALFMVVRPSELLTILLIGFSVGVAFKARKVGFGPRFRSSSRRLGAMLVSYCVYLLMTDLLFPMFPGANPEVVFAFLMVEAAFLELLLDTLGSAVLISNAHHIPVAQLWIGQLKNRLPLHGALVSVAALMGVAYPRFGWLTFPLFLMPLLAARYAFKRYASIHKTYVQTVRALSRVPELIRYTQEGHSVRVAELATVVAREQGLGDNEVQDLEFAALLHDVGWLFFPDASDAPQSIAGTVEEVRVAEASAQLIAKTPYLARVADIVRSHAEPAGAKNMLESRILKLANAYVELTEEGGPQLPSSSAYSHLESDKENYDVEVVSALARVLERQGLRLAA